MVALGTHLPAPALAGALAMLVALAVVGGGLFAALSDRAWPKAVGTIGAVGSLALPGADAPLLALPAWASVLVTLLFLYRLHAVRGDRATRGAGLGARVVRICLALAVLALPVLAAVEPDLVPTALAASREAAVGGGAVLVGLVILCAGATIHLVRIAATRARPAPEASP